jgi:hypothetical protein
MSREEAGRGNLCGQTDRGEAAYLGVELGGVDALALTAAKVYEAGGFSGKNDV